MAAQYPLILLPEPIVGKRNKDHGGAPNLKFPSKDAQKKRISSQFDALTKSLEGDRVHIQQHPDNLEVEHALVFEVAGSLASFFGTVQKIDGLDWLGDFDIEAIEPDEFFYGEDDNGNKKPFTSRVYCIMSNKKALDELLSYWHHYAEDENYGFERGYGSLKHLFEQLRTIREWNTQDRLEDTGILEYWRESLEIAGASTIPFEIELFFRDSEIKRKNASNNVRKIVSEMGGKCLSECIIEEISYHGILIRLPRNKIEEMLGEAREEISLAVCNDIMFLRPVAQLVGHEPSSEEFIEEEFGGGTLPANPPVVALFDGMPLQNHEALRGRLVVDDPDNFSQNYPSSARYHGTAMASLVSHGDLNSPQQESLGSKVYVRPVLNICWDNNERFPEDRLFVDLVHSAVKRMIHGDGSERPSAPTVKIINLSIGDPNRMYFTIGSPLAKLLDWLSCEYEVLFIVSAGNQDLSIIPDLPEFDKLRISSIEQREGLVLKAIRKNARNHRLYAPAESINALTVGSTFEDYSSCKELPHAIFPVSDESLSPFSSFGPGLSSAIKPDILYPGGRFFIHDNGDGGIAPVYQPTREPGCKVALPSRSLSPCTYGYEFGTSVSAALVSHEAALCFDTLVELFEQNNQHISLSKYAHILIKGMLAHGISWSSLNDKVSASTDETKHELHKWIGNGRPDITLARECNRNRITAIGFGELKANEGAKYKLPLPLNFRKEKVKRKLTVTLAYMAPISSNRKEYKRAHLWFDLEGETKDYLAKNRELTDYRAMRRGSLQHEVFESSSIIPWDESEGHIEVTVNCGKQTNLPSFGKQKVPFAIFISFEAAEGTDVYLPVIDKLRTAVKV